MTNISEGELVDQGALPPEDFHDNIHRISEIAEYYLEVDPDLMLRLDQEASNLLIDRQLLYAAAAALQVGHIVLQGPPGTGKSSLARALCRAFHCSYLPVTAHEDWTTFEVIGRQTLIVNKDGKEQIIPINGFFTEAVIRCAGSIVRHFDADAEPQATWLLIDELNRAHLDRAFGELFSVLGTDDLVPIILPHQPVGNCELTTPRRFRLIATLNSIDRQFVNNLGQGLKRRFTFLTVDVPPARDKNEPWGDAHQAASIGAREFAVVIRRAAERVAKRIPYADSATITTKKQELTDFLLVDNCSLIEKLFELVACIRYSSKGSSFPYLPIGTAQLIDTVELFLNRVCLEDASKDRLPELLDWATAIKLAPLFDVDTITPSSLETYVRKLEYPFNMLMKRELLQILAAGQYYVE